MMEWGFGLADERPASDLERPQPEWQEWPGPYLSRFREWAEQLILMVPELGDADLESRWLCWGEGAPMPYVYFGEVVIPSIKPLLEGPGQDQLLGRIFAQIEELAQSPDPAIKGVVADGMESLGQARQWIHRARTYMGPETLRLSFLGEPPDWPSIRDATGIARIWWQLYYRVWYRRRFWWPPRWLRGLRGGRRW